jgi:hypothetical protein
MSTTTWEGYKALLLGRTATVNFGTAAPTVGQNEQNSVVINEAATPGVPYAWLCTAGGNPGTWTPIHTLQNALTAPRSLAGGTDTIVPATDKIVVYTGGTACTVTLPTTPPVNGIGPIYLVNVNSGSLTLSTAGTLVGSATVVTATSAAIMSVGAVWYRVS